MRAGIRMAAAVAAIALLAACGPKFAFGERLLPASYGPPFGAALKDNQPHHPHHPAADERHAEADSAQARHYRSHQACHAALSSAVAAHGAHGRIERISSIESIGLYESGGVVHEQRCSDYVLSHRSWCVTGGEAAGHGTAHKRAEPGDAGCGTPGH